MNKIFILAGHSFKELVRKKDFYLLLFLFTGLIAFFYNKSFFGVNDISRYLKDAGYSLIILFSMIIAVSFSARQIPAEIEKKTILPLLAKPVGRNHFVLGKFAGSLFISAGAFTAFFILYLSAVAVRGEGVPLVLIFQAYVLSLLLLALLSAISVFLSLFLTVAANITVTFLVYFLVYCYNDTLYSIFLSSEEKISYLYGAIYYILPHFEFYNIKIRLVHLWDPLPIWVVFSIILYTLIYISIIMWSACLAFKKKSL